MKLKYGPREKLESFGINSLSDEEILAIILKTGTKEKNVIEMSKDILNEIMTINLLDDYSFNELMNFKGIGKAKAMTIVCALELSRRIRKRKCSINKINTPRDLYELFKNEYSEIPYERIGIAYINANMRLIHKELLDNGTFNSVPVNYREIIKRALKLNSSYIGLIHNHPGGFEYPSKEDIKAIGKLENMLNEFDIKLFDSLVITEKTYFSMKYSDKPKEVV